MDDGYCPNDKLIYNFDVGVFAKKYLSKVIRFEIIIKMENIREVVAPVIPNIQKN